MKFFVYYRSVDGKIVKAESWSFKSKPPLPEGADSLLEVDGFINPRTHYVEENTVRPKKKMDTRYRVEGFSVMFFALPKSTEIEVEQNMVITDGGLTTVEFDLPGKYRFSFSDSPQHLDTQLEVTLG